MMFLVTLIYSSAIAILAIKFDLHPLTSIGIVLTIQSIIELLTGRVGAITDYSGISSKVGLIGKKENPKEYYRHTFSHVILGLVCISIILITK
jgi:hypothetical protein